MAMANIRLLAIACLLSPSFRRNYVRSSGRSRRCNQRYPFQFSNFAGHLAAHSTNISVVCRRYYVNANCLFGGLEISSRMGLWKARHPLPPATVNTQLLLFDRSLALASFPGVMRLRTRMRCFIKLMRDK
ncbi:hypothetical protein SCHPADRAFT_419310 [Schizopora paradoxa]|uniref:Secreted protein n=1 Tax=Schizopora paradoxa TaxID=27342 RepID=A0A0H2RSK8_9AGAM|nr:hypothetical protein SCHPADRAFT_419310 [Schizopora paradoxa]